MQSLNITKKVPRGILRVVVKQKDLFVPGKVLKLAYNVSGPNAEAY